MRRTARRPASQSLSLWRWPIVLGFLSLVGLLVGLADDGWGDVLAWLTLGLVTAVCLRFAPGMPPRR